MNIVFHMDFMDFIGWIITGVVVLIVIAFVAYCKITDAIHERKRKRNENKTGGDDNNADPNG